MYRLPTALKAKGDKAEAVFREWLDASGVPHLYVEQSPLTVPEAYRGRIKRPDFIVGVPQVGQLAFDVKAKSLYDGQLLFDPAEVEKLTRFAGLFHLTVNFACFDEATPDVFYWVPLADLELRPREFRGKNRVIPFPVTDAFTIMLEHTFLQAVMQVTEETMLRN
ncbi:MULTISPECIES: hypothetical protein [unclassified Aureimonas]|uniref:hypothetical protein n=1 Tax=unclassified Aureimonas TaxID=2615206 RepID=UPI000700DA05|nr:MULTISPECIES: hypothetical protein [unclassified Aureimonas]KQT65859.1 hypothetical protein ASG62_21445 [Aureimonas sp. Leaf427]KQT78078.1 hypothetical protein ASG54_03405 [Aureimonas sp. Leaf460]